ncbi:cupin domain-containing protein [Streptomyces sp. KMM 9044]|uniref:cupin domain-containing protein n=1 Tax=Streptomyces sp. KMM 9044 TaxID=2744474 RepID=UPI00215114B9|nr:cupin domain-containing protein [Streptomyces sp. KMM 9044]WAX78627.1 cupin domain-containing protein [Streptomyces sp. KMM 9044]
MVTFPGGTGLSGLEVYPWEAADGCHGGSPHLHTVCTEGYVVVAGGGELQTLTAQGYTSVPLRTGTVAWFSPGTVHRAVNHGGLRVIVVMQNAGLPEAGDAVLTFPPDVLADADRYRAAATLDPADPEGSARRRRDLAVAGFQTLRDHLADGNPEPLLTLYRQAAALVRPRAAAWRDIVTAGPAAAVAASSRHIDALLESDSSHLREAQVMSADAPAPDDRAFGMCGRLDTYRMT